MRYTTMNTKIFLLASCLTLGLGFTSCFDLNKSPEGELSTDNPFTSTGEIRNYLNMFYETGLRRQGLFAGGGSGIAGDDVMSDNISGSALNARLNGQVALSDAKKLDEYTHIRDVNYLLTNLKSHDDNRPADYKKTVGAARIIRDR